MPDVNLGTWEPMSRNRPRFGTPDEAWQNRFQGMPGMQQPPMMGQPPMGQAPPMGGMPGRQPLPEGMAGTPEQWQWGQQQGGGAPLASLSSGYGAPQPPKPPQSLAQQMGLGKRPSYTMPQRPNYVMPQRPNYVR